MADPDGSPKSSKPNNQVNSPWQSQEFRASVAALAVVIISVALVALLRNTMSIDGDATTVALLVIPLLVYGIVSGRLRELSAGPSGLSAIFDALEQKVEANTAKMDTQAHEISEVENMARTAAVTAAEATPNPIKNPAEITAASSTGWDINGSKLPPPTVIGDQQKGRFGGRAGSNGRLLSADVRESSSSARLFDIYLQVSSVDASTKPLKGEVIFYLHESFPRPVRVVAVQDGIAALKLLEVISKIATKDKQDRAKLNET